MVLNGELLEVEKNDEVRNSFPHILSGYWIPANTQYFSNISFRDITLFQMF